MATICRAHRNCWRPCLLALTTAAGGGPSAEVTVSGNDAREIAARALEPMDVHADRECDHANKPDGTVAGEASKTFLLSQKCLERFNRL